MSQKTQRRAARSSNGVLGAFTGGPKGPVAVGRGALARAAGTLGTTASLGALGPSSGGFTGRPSAARTRPGGALSGIPATSPAPSPSTLRPRPGRGVNGVLALAATPYYTAMDRIRTR